MYKRIIYSEYKGSYYKVLDTYMVDLELTLKIDNEKFIVECTISSFFKNNVDDLEKMKVKDICDKIFNERDFILNYKFPFGENVVDDKELRLYIEKHLDFLELENETPFFLKYYIPQDFAFNDSELLNGLLSEEIIKFEKKENLGDDFNNY